MAATIARGLARAPEEPLERGTRPDEMALARGVDRLVGLGVALTTRALAQEPAPELTIAQWRALVIVTGADGLRMGEIARRIGASEPSASRLVGRLASMGFVGMVPDPRDGRATRVAATAVGRAIVETVVERRRRMIADALASSAPLPASAAQDVDRLARSLEHLG